MKKLFLFFLSCSIISGVSAQYKTLHDQKEIKIIQHDTLDFSQFYGKKVLIVNTASFCGFTPEFTQLQQLYTQYKQYNFEIVGFPCNDFGQQDPGDDSTIYAFAHGQYGVTFQMMSKISITAHDTAAIYKWLQKKSRNGVANKSVTWNFNKFCIDEAGHWVAYYDGAKSPLDPAITNWIMTPSVLGIAPEYSSGNMVQLTQNLSGSSIDLTVNSLSPDNMKISLYDVDGRLISNIYNGRVADQQVINYNYSSISPGIYFIKVLSNGKEQTIRYAFVR